MVYLKVVLLELFMPLKEKVYKLIKRVPRGKVVSYKEVGMVLNTKAYQAIGQILKSNKDPVNIPCFKVVKSNGEVSGYAGNDPKNIKKKILKLKDEGIEIRNGKIDQKHFHKF